MTGHVKSDAFAKLKRQRGVMATLARELGVAEQSVHKWKQIPLERVFRVSAILRVPPESLRPDFFAEDPLRYPRMPESWLRFGQRRQAEEQTARKARGVVNGKLTAVVRVNGRA